MGTIWYHSISIFAPCHPRFGPVVKGGQRRMNFIGKVNFRIPFWSRAAMAGAQNAPNMCKMISIRVYASSEITICIDKLWSHGISFAFPFCVGHASPSFGARPFIFALNCSFATIFVPLLHHYSSSLPTAPRHALV